MNNFIKIFGIAVLITGISFSTMNARSFKNFSSAPESGNPTGGGNCCVILSNTKGFQIMGLHPGSVNSGNTLLAELASENSGQADLEVKTTTGEKIWAGAVSLAKGYNAVKFKIQNLRSGIYFLNIKTADGQATKTFSVK